MKFVTGHPMTLDVNKVTIKTSLTACFGQNFLELEGADDFMEALENKMPSSSMIPLLSCACPNSCALGLQ